MRKWIGLIPLVLFFSTARSQQPDHSSSASDTALVNEYISLSASQKLSDSAIYWAERALVLSKKAGWLKGEIKAQEQIGNVYFSATNNHRALEYFLSALKLSEQTGDTRSTIELYRKIGRIHGRQGDHKIALQYYRTAIELLAARGEDQRSFYFAIGSSHDNLKAYDSALYYYQRAYEYVSASSDKKQLAGILSHLGVLHLRMKNAPLALSYARMAVNAFEIYSQGQTGSAYRHLADIFRDQGMRDSAFYYAEKNYRHGLALNSKVMQYEGAELMAELAPDPVTSVKYYRITQELRDSIYSSEKNAAVNNLAFVERQRQQELQQAREKAAAERNQDIQYAAIAVGLIAFLVFYIILSHIIVAKEKPVRFLGALSLLMVFEFVNLVLHPYVSDMTHHSPLLMLLVMVAIASTLIPLHHRLEKWAIHRLVERNKRIRLSAAKKTIAKLEGTPVTQD